MPYASHRVVGVMELEPTCTLVESNSIPARQSLADRSSAAAIHKISCELADSRIKPYVAFESTVKVDSATLQRELEAELSRLLAKCGCVA